jgi:hypothetical protein
MSEPRSGSDRVTRAQDSTKVHQHCVANFVFLAETGKNAIVEWHPRLTRSLPLLGSDVELILLSS